MRKKIIEFFGKKIFKPQKTTGREVITSFPPNVSKTNLEKALKDVNLKTLKMKGKMKGDFQKMDREIEPFRRKLRQTLMKDVLMGRGVIPKKKGKKKMMAKKTETPMQKAVKKNKNKKRII